MTKRTGKNKYPDKKRIVSRSDSKETAEAKQIGNSRMDKGGDSAAKLAIEKRRDPEMDEKIGNDEHRRKRKRRESRKETVEHEHEDEETKAEFSEKREKIRKLRKRCREIKELLERAITSSFMVRQRTLTTDAHLLAIIKSPSPTKPDLGIVP